MASAPSKGWVITGLVVTLAGSLMMKMDYDNRMSAIEEREAASRAFLETQKKIAAEPLERYWDSLGMAVVGARLLWCGSDSSERQKTYRNLKQSGELPGSVTHDQYFDFFQAKWKC